MRTENSILTDYLTESPNVRGDDRAALLLPDPGRRSGRDSIIAYALPPK